MKLMNRTLVALFYGMIVALSRHVKDDDFNDNDEIQKTKTNMTTINPWLLFSWLLAQIVVAVLFKGSLFFSFNQMFRLIIGVFISVAIYYAVFLLCLPLLRKYISAKTVALLWLIPNFIHITVMHSNAPDRPIFVLDIGNTSFQGLSLVWISVALIVFASYVVRHFIFRYKLLHNAGPVETDSVRALWDSMQLEFGFKKPVIGIVTSCNTQTPLSIGLTQLSTVLVLPHTDYSEDELKLIFRHELVHIKHLDSQIKLFIAFCNAMCWFNPLMWIAMRKCSEDLELSCDEYVLEGSSKEETLLYSNLILSAVGSSAGFTTCLSANAAALKYRLSSIYNFKEKLGGSIIAGVLMTAMILTSGLIAFSFNHQALTDVFDKNVKGDSVELSSLLLIENSSRKQYSCVDPDAFNDYLFNLEICELTGVYNNMNHDGKTLDCQYVTDEGRVLIRISDKEVSYMPLYDSGRRSTCTYYLDEPVDWDYILSKIQIVQDTITWVDLE